MKKIKYGEDDDDRSFGAWSVLDFDWNFHELREYRYRELMEKDGIISSTKMKRSFWWNENSNFAFDKKPYDKNWLIVVIDVGDIKDFFFIF